MTNPNLTRATPCQGFKRTEEKVMALHLQVGKEGKELYLSV